MAHPVTRRDFLKIGAAGLASAVLAGCQSPRRWVELEPYVRAPEEQLAGVATWYASTCRQCPAGCGILVRTMNGRAVKIEGNPEHPLNQGKLCARGQAGLQLLYNPDRLTGAVQQAQRDSRQFEPVAWEAGINTLYEKLSTAGAGVAVWAGSTISGHLLDLFQRLTVAVSAPPPLIYDSYTSLHGYHTLAGVNQALYGQLALPNYYLSQADVVLSFGADLFGTGLSAARYGREFGQFRDQPLGKRGYLVHLAPRMSIDAAMADKWIPIRPGTEGLVASALLRIIADLGAGDLPAQGLGSAAMAARAQSLLGGTSLDLASVASQSEIPEEELLQLARTFASAGQSLAIPGGHLAGIEGGAAAVTAVQALNLVSGTAGGLALSPPSPADVILGAEVAPFSGVQALIDRMRAGQVQVLLVHGANPAHDLPDKAGFRDALAQVPYVVSFAPIVDETAAWADLILPDRTYLEGWGYALAAPGFDQPAVSSQQPVVMPVFDSRSTADILLTVGQGIPALASSLPWVDEVAFLKEAVDQLGPGAHGGLEPDVRWSRFQQHGGWWPAEPPAAAVPTLSAALALQPANTQFAGAESEYPYFLHLYPSTLLSDGRGASQPWLQGAPDPMTTVSWQTWVELHPETAQQLGVRDGDIVRVASPEGELEAPVCTYPAIRPDTVAIPLGQGHTDLGRYARDRGANPMQLVGAQVDSTGSSLAWAGLRVNVQPTGKKVALALFENKEGVTRGFLNMEFPE